MCDSGSSATVVDALDKIVIITLITLKVLVHFSHKFSLPKYQFDYLKI
jgi:hypothetical protein